MTKTMDLWSYESETYEDGVDAGVNTTLLSDTLFVYYESIKREVKTL